MLSDCGAVQVTEQTTSVQVVQQVASVQPVEQKPATVEVQEICRELQVVEIGIVGPQGPIGQLNFPIEIVAAKTGDVLSFDGAAWTNRDQTDITDGGNF